MPGTNFQTYLGITLCGRIVVVDVNLTKRSGHIMYKNKFKNIIFILIFVLVAPNLAIAETQNEQKADVVFFWKF